MKKIFFLLLINFGALSNTLVTDHLAKCHSFANSLTKVKDQNQRLTKGFRFIWEQTLDLSPEYATFLGYPNHNDRWSDLSLSAFEIRKKIDLCHLNIVESTTFSKLTDAHKINFQLAADKIKKNISAYEFHPEYLSLNQLEGIHIDLADILESAPKSSLKDYQDRIQRLQSFPLLIQQTIALLNKGTEVGITSVSFLMKKVPEQINIVIVDEVEKSPFFESFKNLPDIISNQDQLSIQKSAKELITNKVNPSLKALKDFIEKSYIPKCRDDISFSRMPNGQMWYKYLISFHTTTSLSAEDIHNLGLKEVNRLNSEMEKIRKAENFKGTKEEFHKFLHSDPQFFFHNPKDLISVYQQIAKQIDPELPKLFKELPRLSYGIRPMPDYKAKSAPTAYYIGGSLEAGRAGFFEANTYNLNSRPKWEMEVLTLHEAVPGHHLQISLAQELGDQPDFRKHSGYTAFVEGWGLYSESLGSDLGLYKDSYSKYGQLSYEMWRAVRLVVDTGMHAMGWSKEKALNYFLENVPKDRLQAENEIDRYITWPGQALAYKIGELKIKELKQLVQKKLGEKFNVRDFHNQILKNGAVPISIMEKQVVQWLEIKEKAAE